MTREDIFGLVVVFLFGSAIGSFLNVCIWRLPLGKSLLWPPSHCPKCFQPVGLWNVPILGYFLLRGRCAKCGDRFSFRYAFIEFLNGALLSYLYYHLVIQSGAPLPLFLAYATLTMILVVATFTDLDWKIIPRTLTVFGVVVGLVFSAAWPKLHALYLGARPGGGRFMEQIGRFVAQIPPLDGLFAALGGLTAGVLLILVVRWLGSVVFRREAMGLGDAKLMAVIGAFLGWKAIPVVFLVAAFVGAVVGIASWFRTREREMPLGPFLSLGALVVMLHGNALIRFWCVDVMHLESAPSILSQFPR